MSIHMFRTQNGKDGRQTCHHCRNSGIVEFDPIWPSRVVAKKPTKDADPWIVTASYPYGIGDVVRVVSIQENEDEVGLWARAMEASEELRNHRVPGVGAPCPMCVLGGRVARTDDVVKWTTGFFRRARWENGLSSEHRGVCAVVGCPVPSVGRHCDFHTNDAPPPTPPVQAVRSRAGSLFPTVGSAK